MLAWRSVNRPKHVVRWYLIAQSLTTHASKQPAVGAAKHHSQNAYLTAMFGQYIRGYLTTEYGFNLRQNSPLNIQKQNNTGYSDTLARYAHAMTRPVPLGFFINKFPL